MKVREKYIYADFKFKKNLWVSWFVKKNSTLQGLGVDIMGYCFKDRFLLRASLTGPVCSHVQQPSINIISHPVQTFPVNNELCQVERVLVGNRYRAGW